MRETAAQALGAATQPLPPAALRLLLGVLRQLSECSEWEVRHGGLLGLKYVLAARGGAAHGSGGGAEGGSSGGLAGDAQLLEAVLPAALVGLRVSGAVESRRVEDRGRAAEYAVGVPCCSRAAHMLSLGSAEAAAAHWCRCQVPPPF